MHTISGRLCSITGRLDRKIPQDLTSFILQQWVRNKFLPFVITFYVGIFCIVADGFLATLSRLFQYCFFGRLGQMLMICVKISTFPLQSLQSGVSMVLSMLYFTELVTVLSKLPYSVLHTLLDCISPPRPSPRHLPEHFFHHFLVCRVCLHMTLGGVPHIKCWVF